MRNSRGYACTSCVRASGILPRCEQVRRISLLTCFSILFYLLAAHGAAGAMVTTDRLDYPPFSYVIITGSGFEPGETVSNQVVQLAPTPAAYDPWEVLADANGGFTTEWLVFSTDLIGATLQITSTGLSSGLSGQATFTDASVGIDFSQFLNGNFGTNDNSWTGGAINSTKALYAEGMCVPQRLFLLDIPSSVSNNHSIQLIVLATKGGNHAYDFVTSWDSAAPAADFVAPGRNLMASLSGAQCNAAISANAAAICASMHTSPNQVLAVYTNELTNVPGFPAGDYPTGDRVQSRAEAFDILVGGSRGCRVYADPGATTFTNIHFSFDGYEAGSGEYYEVYTLIWTSDTTNLLLELAGHLAQSKDEGQNLAYLASGGSAKVNGGPYHFKLATFDGGNIGSQDNQIQVGTIFQAPSCGVTPTLTNVCAGTAVTFVGTVTDGGTPPFTYQWRGTNSSGVQILSTNIVTSDTNTSITVTAAGTYSLIIVDSVGLTSFGGCAGTLVVHTPASATSLSNQGACPGGSVTFCTTASGTPPFSFTWRKDGQTITNPPADPRLQITIGTSNTCLTITNIGVGDAGQYCVVVSNFCAQVTNCAALIVDTNPPVLTCPGDFSVQCFGDVPAPLTNFVSQQLVTNGCVITVNRTYAATNACGQLTNCVQAITVHDTIPPVITCATNKSVECGAAWTFNPPSATDNCSGTNVAIAIVGTVTNQLCGNTFFATRTWSATDLCGNSNTCSQIVTVLDTTAPSITCVSNRTVQCGTAWTFDPPSAPADACGTNQIVIVNTLTNPLCGATFSATRTWAAIDPCGNSNTCSQIITVVDTNGPAITCSTNRTVECGSAWTFDPPSAPADACGTNHIVIINTVTNPLCG